jgi:hypothetical protein
MKIGIDFGGVIVKPADGDSPFDPTRGRAIEQNNAIESIAELIKRPNNEVWVISKASKSTQSSTRSWLNVVDFYQRSGFIETNLLFCSKRSEKRDICEPLGITHFIDDNLDVLTALSGLAPNLYLFGHDQTPDGVLGVKNWLQLMQKLTK